MTFKTVNLVFDGNSLTNGSTPRTQALMEKRFNVRSANYGVGGQTTTQMLADAPAQVDIPANLNRDYNIIVVWEGINDIFFGKSAIEAYTNLATYCKARQLAGFKVVLATLTPRKNAGTPPTQEADRLTVNELLRSNWTQFADALADVAALPELGLYSQTENLVYYYDLVHMTNLGFNVASQVLADTILKLLPPLPTATYPPSHTSAYLNKGVSSENVTVGSCAIVSLTAINLTPNPLYVLLFDRSSFLYDGLEPIRTFPVYGYTEITPEILGGLLALGYGLAVGVSSDPHKLVSVPFGSAQVTILYRGG